MNNFNWKDTIYLLLVAGLMIAFIKVELYFIYKSRENFRNLGTAYRELKQSRTNLEKLIK
jgi:hypothetical protein